MEIKAPHEYRIPHEVLMAIRSTKPVCKAAAVNVYRLCVGNDGEISEYARPQALTCLYLLAKMMNYQNLKFISDYYQGELVTCKLYNNITSDDVKIQIALPAGKALTYVISNGNETLTID